MPLIVLSIFDQYTDPGLLKYAFMLVCDLVHVVSPEQFFTRAFEYMLRTANVDVFKSAVCACNEISFVTEEVENWVRAYMENQVHRLSEMLTQVKVFSKAILGEREFADIVFELLYLYADVARTYQDVNESCDELLTIFGRCQAQQWVRFKSDFLMD